MPLLFAALSCGDMLPREERPLFFSGLETKSSLSVLHSSFRVRAVCLSGGEGVVMDGYRVNHTPGGWSYTEGEGTESQELKYWNESSRTYRFHAGAPAGRVESLTDRTLVLRADSTATLSGVPLFSDPCLVGRGDPSYGETVRMAFRYALPKVNVAFRYAGGTALEVKGIRLLPPSPIARESLLEIGYSWDIPSAGLTELTPLRSSLAPLTFPDISLSSSASESSLPLYLPPDPASAGTWTMEATVDSRPVSVRFSVSRAWEPGRSYLYRFEYTDAANLLFVGTDEVLFTGESLTGDASHDFE